MSIHFHLIIFYTEITNSFDTKLSSKKLETNNYFLSNISQLT